MGFYRWSSWDETVLSNLDSTDIDKNIDIMVYLLVKEGPKIIVNDLSWLTRWFFSCFTKIRANTILSRRSLVLNQVVFDVTGQVRQENGFKEELATHIVRKHPALSGDLDGYVDGYVLCVW